MICWILAAFIAPATWCRCTVFYLFTFRDVLRVRAIGEGITRTIDENRGYHGIWYTVRAICAVSNTTIYYWRKRSDADVFDECVETDRDSPDIGSGHGRAAEPPSA